jgi:6-phosphogluconolactonase
VCEYDSAKGTLREVQALDTLPSPRPESWVADVHVSGDGKRVYVSNRGHDSLAVFEADVAGRLTRLGMPSCGGSCPRNFALAPGGNFVLSANQMSNQLAVMPVLRGAAEVGAPTAHASVTGASCIKFVK